jgi:predicted RNA-binding protein with PUA-like domain
MRQYWLLKTEPEVYSIDQFNQDKTTFWNGIRNFQARNNLKKMKPHDLAFIYHTSEERRIVGTGFILNKAEPEIPLAHPVKPGDWVHVKIAFESQFLKTLSLSELKKNPLFEKSPLVTQSRLSVVPLTEEQARFLLDYFA